MSNEIISLAQQKFTQLLEEQLKRIEKMKTDSAGA